MVKENAVYILPSYPGLENTTVKIKVTFSSAILRYGSLRSEED